MKEISKLANISATNLILKAPKRDNKQSGGETKPYKTDSKFRQTGTRTRTDSFPSLSVVFSQISKTLTEICRHVHAIPKTFSIHQLNPISLILFFFFFLLILQGANSNFLFFLIFKLLFLITLYFLPLSSSLKVNIYHSIITVLV